MRVKYPTPGSLPAPTKPFGSINVTKDDITKQIKVSVQVLLDRLVDKDGKEIEGAEFGLALDGSRSMKDLYGDSGPFVSTPNHVEPVAKAMLNFLSTYAGDGAVHFAFWSVGPGGSEIEEVGKLTTDKVSSLKVKPKKPMGGKTYLMPIINHFVEDKLKNAPWGMGIIVTDGMVDDMSDVEQWTEQFAQQVASGKRKLIKLVLIGLGEHVDADQLERLDGFEASVDVDVWSSKLASEMEVLSEIFDEVMSENLIVAPSARVVDNKGNLLVSYNDGLPSKFEFPLKTGATKFKLEIPGQAPIEQDLADALNLLR